MSMECLTSDLIFVTICLTLSSKLYGNGNLGLFDGNLTYVSLFLSLSVAYFSLFNICFSIASQTSVLVISDLTSTPNFLAASSRYSFDLDVAQTAPLSDGIPVPL